MMDHGNPQDWTPEQISNFLLSTVVRMTNGAIVQSYEHTPGEPHPILVMRDELDEAPEDLTGSTRMQQIDWERAAEVGPQSRRNAEGEMEVALSDIALDSAFYTRFFGRMVADGVLDGDQALVAFVKAWSAAVTELCMELEFPQGVAFVRDFLNHSLNMAVMAGTMIPGDEVGAYELAPHVESTGEAEPDAADGIFGVSKEQWLTVDFPHGEEIYDGLMERIRLADSCIRN